MGEDRETTNLGSDRTFGDALRDSTRSLGKVHDRTRGSTDFEAWLLRCGLNEDQRAHVAARILWGDLGTDLVGDDPTVGQLKVALMTHGRFVARADGTVDYIRH